MKWDGPLCGRVCCPGCGEPAIDRLEDVAPTMPRWACPDPRCVFVHGWRLEFGADVGIESEGYREDLFAVPCSQRGERVLSGAVVWPRSSRAA